MTREFASGELLVIARRGASIEANAVAEVEQQIDESLVEAARLIDSSAGKVIVVGSGTSGTIGRRLAHLLSVSGTPGLYVHPMDALHGTMGAIESDDVVIALSKGGESDEINQLCRLLDAQGCVIIGIGENPESTLAGLSRLYIHLHTIDQADPENTLAMGSTLVTAVWGDALARVLMHMHGWRVEQSLRIHPAGAVGKHAGEARSDG
ncbi:KpsF/GutQ family sugar-phosphate isomerase [Actinomyces culturomici]|uniref:KpsF/GutQ family sugar-phosphate isomerase n=1 Tax=Actinomyces culturomici TaxID=1926276 RepID=UPI000E1FBAB4|nr:SIS domain-containing protein [Actinomyces culturomici]